MKTLRASAVAAAIVACVAPATRSTPAAPAMSLPFATDTNRTEHVANGVTRRFIYSGTGPWAINVLDVDRRACYSAIAVKGFPNSIGRKKTSQLLSELDSTGTVVGGVNADFFAPNGRPTNLHASRGRVITGPNRQPVLMFDSSGAPAITQIRVAGRMDDVTGVAESWNRPIANGIAFFDAAWGPMTDTAANTIEIVVRGSDMLFVDSDTATAGVAIPADGGVFTYRGKDLAVGRATADARRSPKHQMTLMGPAGRLQVVEAVGGRPVLVRDSTIVPEVDTQAGAGFALSRHPRTAVGIARNGSHLLLVTVDGRQKPYSDGMTLRELASLMLALGARDAINLDGGGSTTLVYKDPRTKQLNIANRPSDPTGERAVGNALAIVNGCRKP